MSVFAVTTACLAKTFLKWVDNIYITRENKSAINRGKWGLAKIKRDDNKLKGRGKIALK